MKNNIKMILPIIAFIAYIGFGIYGDYTWSEGIIEDYKNAGWSVISKQDNYASITSPWTLIKTPVTGYWMVKDNAIKRYQRGIYLVPIAHVHYDYDKIIEDVDFEFIDIARKQIAYATPEQIKKNDLEHLQWKSNWYTLKEGQQGYEIINYVTAKVR